MKKNILVVLIMLFLSNQVFAQFPPTCTEDSRKMYENFVITDVWISANTSCHLWGDKRSDQGREKIEWLDIPTFEIINDDLWIYKDKNGWYFWNHLLVWWEDILSTSQEIDSLWWSRYKLAIWTMCLQDYDNKTTLVHFFKEWEAHPIEVRSSVFSLGVEDIYKVWSDYYGRHCWSLFSSSKEVRDSHWIIITDTWLYTTHWKILKDDRSLLNNKDQFSDEMDHYKTIWEIIEELWYAVPKKEWIDFGESIDVQSEFVFSFTIIDYIKIYVNKVFNLFWF
jgi:hypothetical protein